MGEWWVVGSEWWVVGGGWRGVDGGGGVDDDDIEG